MKFQKTKPLYPAFLLLTLFAFIAHQIIQKQMGIHLPLLDNYLDPFCLGVLATFLFSLEHHWRFRGRNLSLLEVIILIIILTLITELLFPYLSDKFVRDWWDGVAITAGSMVCYFLQSE